MTFLSSRLLNVPSSSCPSCPLPAGMHMPSFRSAECLWAGHPQMLHDTSGIQSLSIDFSGHWFPLGGLTVTSTTAWVSAAECSSSWAQPFAPALIHWRQLCFALFGGNDDFSAAMCNGLLHDILWVVSFNVTTTGATEDKAI